MSGDSTPRWDDAQSFEPLLPYRVTVEGPRQARVPPQILLGVDLSTQEKLLGAGQLLSPRYDVLCTTPRTPKPSYDQDNTSPVASARGRNLKWSSAFFLIVSRVIGSGIFATPGVIAKSTGSIGLSLLLWSVGAVVSACGLAVSLELGCMLPRSGGENTYLQFIYRKPRFMMSTIIAVQAMLLGFTASNCIVFGKYMLFAFGMEATDRSQRLCAAGLIIVVTFIHGRFLKAGIALQNALGWIKVCVIAFMALAGISVLLFKPARIVQGMHHWQQPLSWDHIWQGSEWSFGSIASSFFKVSFAYSGYDNLNSVMDEVQDPIRTLKTAAPAAMVLIFVFYLLLNISYFVVVPLNEIKNSGELVAALFFERLLGEGLGARILPVLIALSAAGSVMVTVFSHSRINQEIARQGFLPFSKRLSSSKPFNTPLGGLLVHLVPSLVVILLPPQGALYSFILELKAYPAQMTSLAICAGLLYLRAHRPDLSRPFTAWTPAVYLPVGLNVALLLAPFFPPLEGKEEFTFWYGTYAVVGVATIALAVVYWYVWFRLLPRWRGYRIEEESDELSDGTKITRLVQIKAGIDAGCCESIRFLDAQS